MRPKYITGKLQVGVGGGSVGVLVSDELVGDVFWPLEVLHKRLRGDAMLRRKMGRREPDVTGALSARIVVPLR